MIKVVGLRVKTYSYLIGNGNEDKKEKRLKKVFQKRAIKFENYKNYLKTTELGNKIKYQQKNKINTYSFKNNYEEVIKNNKSKLKTKQRFKSERNNVFTEEINKDALSSYDDIRIQSIDSIETYPIQHITKRYKK